MLFGSFTSYLLDCIQDYPKNGTAPHRKNETNTSLGMNSVFQQPKLTEASHEPGMLHRHNITPGEGQSLQLHEL